MFKKRNIMLHEARQTFIHEEAKKLREKLNIEINTPESFFIVKEILDRYDNIISKVNQHTFSGLVIKNKACQDCKKELTGGYEFRCSDCWTKINSSQEPF